MIATTVRKTVTYVLVEEREKPATEQTPFQLRTLSAAATALIQDSLVGYDVHGTVIVSRPGTGALVACKLGVAGWGNMKDEDGEEVKPRYIVGKGMGGLRVLSPRSLDLLPQFAIDELGGAVMDLNGLGREAPREEEDADADEDPTRPSATRNDSASPAPSQPATPRPPTESSDSPGPAPVAMG